MTSLIIALALSLGILFSLEIKRVRNLIRRSKHGQTKTRPQPQFYQGPVVLSLCLIPSIVITHSGSSFLVVSLLLVLAIWAAACLQKLYLSQELLSLLESRNKQHEKA